MTDIIDDDDDFEELYGEWEPSLYGAAMAENDRFFALLVGGPRWDDPYTIILTRDVVGQTFSRSDVRRELRDIRVLPASDKDTAPSYAAISLQGDIYVVGPEGSEHTIIPGTLAESEDAPEINFTTIIPFDGRWMVAGYEGFMKLGMDQEWENVAPPLETNYPYNEPKWSILGVNDDGDVFVVGAQTTNNRHFNLYPGHPLYRKDMSDEESHAIQRKLYDEQDSYPQLITFFTGKPGAWKQHPLPERIRSSRRPHPYISGMTKDDSGTDYIFGSDGLVIRGTPSSGFVDISSLPDREKHYSAGCCWRDDLILTANSEIFRFDGHLAKTFTPKVRTKLGSPIVQPSELISRNGKLYVFDYGLRYFSFDGKEWTQREIPQELSAQPFKGGDKSGQ